MRQRPFGQNGITVSALGFGAWGIGGAVAGGRSYGTTDDRQSLAALQSAFDGGIRFFDTAPLYGLGHSETLLGQALHRHRDQVFIASKAGYADFIHPADFSPTALRASVEGSLRRLGTDYLDLLQLHDPPADLLTSRPEVAETLLGLRDQGKLRLVGASVKSPADGLSLLDSPLIAALQCNFSMMDLRALDCGLLARAKAQGIAVIARTPLCFGFLSGAYDGDEDFAADDHRSRWPRRQLRAWAQGGKELLAAADPGGEQHDAVTALRFALSFDAVAVTIPGMLTPGQVEANLPAGRLPPLSDEAVARVVACNHAHDGFREMAG